MSTTGLMAPIKINGLKELSRQLKAAPGEAEKMIKPALNEAAQIIVNVARPKIPTLTGAARSSLSVKSTARESRVQAGGTKAPYYPWLDYGGKIGRNGSISRPFDKGGRYIYPAYAQEHANIMRLLEQRIAEAVAAAGLDVE